MSTITLTEEELSQLIEKAKIEALAEVAPDLEALEIRRAGARYQQRRRWQEDQEYREKQKALQRARYHERMATEPEYRERMKAHSAKRYQKVKAEEPEKLKKYNETKKARYAADPAIRQREYEGVKRRRAAKKALALATPGTLDYNHPQKSKEDS